MLREEFAVRDFMSRDVKTIHAYSLVPAAVKVMAENNVGSLVVVDEHGPAGIFTERDLLTHLLTKCLTPEAPIVYEVTAKRFATVSPDETLSGAAMKMLSKRSNLLVYDEDGRLVGIVTSTDILRQVDALGRPFSIRDVISAKVVKVDPATAVGIVAQRMDERRIGSVIVGRGAGPLSIFTERDLLKRVIFPNLRLSARVGEVASKPLITAQLGVGGLDATRIMAKRHIKRLPLFDGSRLAGMVTARDIVEAFAESG